MFATMPKSSLPSHSMVLQPRRQALEIVITGETIASAILIGRDLAGRYVG
jgi:hypothetical protein